MTVYKIRRKSDGLFSTGGCRPRWTRNGKTYPNVGSLMAHLKTVLWRAERETPIQAALRTYKGCEVVAYGVEPVEGASVPVSAFLEPSR